MRMLIQTAKIYKIALLYHIAKRSSIIQIGTNVYIINENECMCFD